MFRCTRRGSWSSLRFATEILSKINRGRQLVQVLVRDNNVDQALRVLKKRLQREGVFREMKLRKYYEKPSEKRVREAAEAVRRTRKLARKRAQREGLLPGKATTKTPAPGKGGPGGRPGRGGPPPMPAI